MWVPKEVASWFQISKDTVDTLRIDIGSLKAENNQLKSELAAIKANNDWFRVRCNQLEFERAQLLEKAYGVKVPVPEITRSAPLMTQFDQSLFEDIGDKQAKVLGLPTYGSDFAN